MEVIQSDQNVNSQSPVIENLTEPNPQPGNNLDAAQVPEPHVQELMRSSRAKKPAINTTDYVVYLQEANFDWGEDNDPVSFSQAVSCDQSPKWTEAMQAELNGFLRPRDVQTNQ